MSNKDKLDSSKASSETVSTTSLNESEDSLERLTSNDRSLDSSSQNTSGAPIKSYVNLAETPQEKIWRLKQETKAIVQREINRGQRRREYFGLDEPVIQPTEALMLAKDYSPGKYFSIFFSWLFFTKVISLYFSISHGQSIQRNIKWNE